MCGAFLGLVSDQQFGAGTPREERTKLIMNSIKYIINIYRNVLGSAQFARYKLLPGRKIIDFCIDMVKFIARKEFRARTGLREGASPGVCTSSSRRLI